MSQYVFHVILYYVNKHSIKRVCVHLYHYLLVLSVGKMVKNYFVC